MSFAFGQDVHFFKIILRKKERKRRETQARTYLILQENGYYSIAYHVQHIIYSGNLFIEVNMIKKKKK